MGEFILTHNLGLISMCKVKLVWIQCFPSPKLVIKSRKLNRPSLERRDGVMHFPRTFTQNETHQFHPGLDSVNDTCPTEITFIVRKHICLCSLRNSALDFSLNGTKQARIV